MLVQARGLERAQRKCLLGRARGVGDRLAAELGDRTDTGLGQQELPSADRQVDGDGSDGQPRLDRQRGGQVAHEPNVDPVGGETGVDQGAGVEFHEVDLVVGTGHDSGCLEQGLQLLLLVPDVEHQARAVPGA